jgi:ABC-type transport system involved in multi-copper enzyme maturation permease subunit
MICLTIRQFRLQAYIAISALVVFAVIVFLTGRHLMQVYDSTVLHCGAAGDCSVATQNLVGTYRFLQAWFDALVLVVPAILGIFWGTPLVARELENGTYRLAWTQGVTRRRWLAVKIAITGTASVAVAGVVSALVTWWFTPLDRVNMTRFVAFDWRDVVPLGYAAFAFALGVTLGMVIRKTVPAMAATLAVFVAVRMSIVEWVRPNILTPLKSTVPFVLPLSSGPVTTSAGALPANDWVLSNLTINGAGKVIGSDAGIGPSGSFNIEAGSHVIIQGGGACPNIAMPTGTPGQPRPPISAVTSQVDKCLHQLGIRQVVSYLPPTRYWPLQWTELAIFVAMTAALCAFSIYWVRRIH